MMPTDRDPAPATRSLPSGSRTGALPIPFPAGPWEASFLIVSVLPSRSQYYRPACPSEHSRARLSEA